MAGCMVCKDTGCSYCRGPKEAERKSEVLKAIHKALTTGTIVSRAYVAQQIVEAELKRQGIKL